MKISQRLDCKGLSCPLPILRIGQTLRNMKIGDILEIEANDLAFEDDVKAFVEETFQEILDINFKGDSIIAVIRKIC